MSIYFIPFFSFYNTYYYGVDIFFLEKISNIRLTGHLTFFVLLIYLLNFEEMRCSLLNKLILYEHKNDFV